MKQKKKNESFPFGSLLVFLRFPCNVVLSRVDVYLNRTH